MTSTDIELAVANFYDYRANTIVPNVHWGLGIHECDMLMVRPSGIATEIEIKISKDDIKADKLKSHGHRSNKIRYLYFAVPYELRDDPNIPSHAGVLSITAGKTHIPHCTIYRQAIPNKAARKLSDTEITKLSKLGCMRIYSLKAKLQAERRKNHERQR